MNVSDACHMVLSIEETVDLKDKEFVDILREFENQLYDLAMKRGEYK